MLPRALTADGMGMFFVLWCVCCVCGGMLVKTFVYKDICICNCEDIFQRRNTHTILNATASFKEKILSGGLYKHLTTLNEVILGYCVFLTQCSAVSSKAVGKAPSNSRGFVLTPIHETSSFLRGNFAGWREPCLVALIDRGRRMHTSKYI